MDNDPIVLLHAKALLTSSPEGAVAYLDGDLRDPEKILGEAAKTLDFGQPMAVLLLGILHDIGDQYDPYGIVRRLVQTMRGGSYLAICHLTAEIYPELAEWARALNERSLTRLWCFATVHRSRASSRASSCWNPASCSSPSGGRDARSSRRRLPPCGAGWPASRIALPAQGRPGRLGRRPEMSPLAAAVVVHLRPRTLSTTWRPVCGLGAITTIPAQGASCGRRSPYTPGLSPR